MNTVAASVRNASRELQHCSESPRLDAELLMGRVLGLSRAALIARGDDILAAEAHSVFSRLVARRSAGQPVAYLTGTREFWSMSLSVTPAVLVPRPETEILVELALQLLPPDDRRSILDLGTGSGAIALALASERPACRVTAVDVSAEALAVATENARTLGITHIDWRRGSWFGPVRGERFDLIAANPPYVAADDPALQELASEPLQALSPGPTGLEALSAIVTGAAQYLHDRGWLILEHGSDQGAQVSALLETNGFSDIRSHVDALGLPRVTLGTIIHHEEHS